MIATRTRKRSNLTADVLAQIDLAPIDAHVWRHGTLPIAPDEVDRDIAVLHPTELPARDNAKSAPPLGDGDLKLDDFSHTAKAKAKEVPPLENQIERPGTAPPLNSMNPDDFLPPYLRLPKACGSSEPHLRKRTSKGNVTTDEHLEEMDATTPRAGTPTQRFQWPSRRRRSILIAPEQKLAMAAAESEASLTGSKRTQSDVANTVARVFEGHPTHFTTGPIHRGPQKISNIPLSGFDKPPVPIDEEKAKRKEIRKRGESFEYGVG